MRTTLLTAPLLALVACSNSGSGTGETDGGASSETGDLTTNAMTAGSATSATGSSTDALPSSTSADESGTESGDPPQACEGSDQTFDDGLEHLGRAQGDSFIEILDLVTRDGLVYSCTATQGLTIWDATPRESPELLVENVGAPALSHPQFPRCQHVALDDDSLRAVITNRSDEIQPQPWLYLMDLANPQAPAPLRGWTGDDLIEGVVLQGDRIWAAAHESGILVFEDQGGSDLVQIGSFSDGSSDAWQPVKIDDTLFVAEGTTGLRSYDISGDDPVLLDTLALEGSSKDVVARGNELFVASSSVLYGVDVSDPSAMTITAERSVTGTAVGLSLGADDVLYTAEWDEVRGYDSTDSELPLLWAEQVPTQDAFSRILDVEADPSNGRVYAGEWTGMHAYASTPSVSAPDIQLDPANLQFGTVEPGESQTRVIIIRNTGTELLEVTNVVTTSENAVPSERCFNVDPGGAYAIEVRVDAGSDANFGGRIEFTTNDPDESAAEATFTGNAIGADVGDPVPEFLLQDTEGNSWSSAELEGNVIVLAYFATF